MESGCKPYSSTAAAAVVYFRLIASAGPSFAAQLNYLIPLWAVLIGVLFLDERPEVKHLIALILILGGILLARLERRSARIAPHPADASRSADGR